MTPQVGRFLRREGGPRCQISQNVQYGTAVSGYQSFTVIVQDVPAGYVAYLSGAVAQQCKRLGREFYPPRLGRFCLATDALA
jgi:hypothetical protein